MPRNDNPHALRLLEALRSTAGDKAAMDFAAAHPLSRSADINRKFCWAAEVSTALDGAFDAETVRRIRRACRCADGRTMAKEIADCIAKAGSLQDGCTMFSKRNRYAFLEYVNERELVFGYRACVCSCVKRVEGTLPLTWCECSCGYAEAMLRQVFGEQTQVELLWSVKTGGVRCEMRVLIA